MLRGVVERGTGTGGQGAGAPDRGQDGHDERLLERVVHRLHAATGDGRVGRLRPAAQPGQGRDRLARRRADLGLLHGQGAGDSPREDFPVPERDRARPGRPRPVERVRARRHDGLRQGDRAARLRARGRAVPSPPARRRPTAPAPAPPRCPGARRSAAAARPLPARARHRRPALPPADGRLVRRARREPREPPVQAP